MHALGFTRYGPPEVLQPLDLPRPEVPADGVLIRVAAAGINPADWRFRSGQFRRAVRLKLPFVPGSDVAGVALAVGSAVTRFRPGDAVFTMLPVREGGGYAQLAVAREALVAPVPTGICLGDAAAVPLAGLTALQALRDKAGLRAGQRVLIYGASGGVGTFAVQIARALGARVTAACSGRNAELVRSLGADEVIDYTGQEVTAGPPRFDVVFDAVNHLAFRRARRVLRAGGTFVTVNPVIGNLTPAWLSAFWGGRRLRSLFVQPSGADLETLGEWLAGGQLKSVIDRTHPLLDGAAAHEYSASGRVRGKLVLTVDEDLAARRAENARSLVGRA
ncbi:oxidoreductase (plasmid) [Deinococcus aetherius]|uniref:Oxidoreductase n=1 Tax=Deinococcus aetherius TaxID=200252 RepID=A0ABM8AJ80_9DEIO|nr:NAD(P)-dependent alcohol dehydrogenase [Deinococcus aetherius]BDP43873.1 oxidoreductase [Deinococcus aetherius]